MEHETLFVADKNRPSNKTKYKEPVKTKEKTSHILYWSTQTLGYVQSPLSKLLKRFH